MDGELTDREALELDQLPNLPELLKPGELESFLMETKYKDATPIIETNGDVTILHYYNQKKEIAKLDLFSNGDIILYDKTSNDIIEDTCSALTGPNSDIIFDALRVCSLEDAINILTGIDKVDNKDIPIMDQIRYQLENIKDSNEINLIGICKGHDAYVCITPQNKNLWIVREDGSIGIKNTRVNIATQDAGLQKYEGNILIKLDDDHNTNLFLNKKGYLKKIVEFID